MKNNKVRFISIFLIMIFIAAFAKPGIVIANEIKGTELNSWMSTWLDDNSTLGTANIPGTHDSAAYKMNGISVFAAPWAKTQDKSITDQLNIGIRYFDLRVYDDLSMHHGGTSVGENFKYHIEEIINFIEKHKSEFVIIRLKNERGDKYNNTLINNLKNKVFGIEKINSFFAKNFDENTKIKDIRGKILLLNDTNDDLPIYNILWKNIVKQDKYEPKNDDEKWEYIKKFLDFKSENKGILLLNHISYTKQPKTIYNVAKYMNRKLYYHIMSIEEDKGKENIGVIIMDYPDKSLIKAIIELND